VAQAVVAKSKSEVEKLLGVRVPDEWYASEVLDFFPMYTQMLIDDPLQLGWGVWLIIHIRLLREVGKRARGKGVHVWYFPFLHKSAKSTSRNLKVLSLTLQIIMSPQFAFSKN